MPKKLPTPPEPDTPWNYNTFVGLDGDTNPNKYRSSNNQLAFSKFENTEINPDGELQKARGYKKYTNLGLGILGLHRLIDANLLETLVVHCSDGNLYVHTDDDTAYGKNNKITVVGLSTTNRSFSVNFGSNLIIYDGVSKPIAFDGTTATQFDTPEIPKAMFIYTSRLWYITDSMLRCSDVGLYTDWTTKNKTLYWEYPMGNHERLVALSGLDVLLVHREYSSFQVQGDSLDNFSFQELSYISASSPSCWCNIANQQVVFDLQNRGFYPLTRGLSTTATEESLKISANMDASFLTVDTTRLRDITLLGIPERDTMLAFMPMWKVSGLDTQWILKFTKTGTYWSTRKSVNCNAVIYFDTKVLLGSKDGWIYEDLAYEAGTFLAGQYNNNRIHFDKFQLFVDQLATQSQQNLKPGYSMTVNSTDKTYGIPYALYNDNLYPDKDIPLLGTTLKTLLFYWEACTFYGRIAEADKMYTFIETYIKGTDATGGNGNYSQIINLNDYTAPPVYDENDNLITPNPNNQFSYSVTPFTETLTTTNKVLTLTHNPQMYYDSTTTHTEEDEIILTPNIYAIIPSTTVLSDSSFLTKADEVTYTFNAPNLVTVETDGTYIVKYYYTSSTTLTINTALENQAITGFNKIDLNTQVDLIDAYNNYIIITELDPETVIVPTLNKIDYTEFSESLGLGTYFITQHGRYDTYLANKVDLINDRDAYLTYNAGKVKINYVIGTSLIELKFPVSFRWDSTETIDTVTPVNSFLLVSDYKAVTILLYQEDQTTADIVASSCATKDQFFHSDNILFMPDRFPGLATATTTGTMDALDLVSCLTIDTYKFNWSSYFHLTNGNTLITLSGINKAVAIGNLVFYMQVTEIADLTIELYDLENHLLKTSTITTAVATKKYTVTLASALTISYIKITSSADIDINIFAIYNNTIVLTNTDDYKAASLLINDPSGTGTEITDFVLFYDRYKDINNVCYDKYTTFDSNNLVVATDNYYPVAQPLANSFSSDLLDFTNNSRRSDNFRYSAYATNSVEHILKTGTENKVETKYTNSPLNLYGDGELELLRQLSKVLYKNFVYKNNFQVDNYTYMGSIEPYYETDQDYLKIESQINGLLENCINYIRTNGYLPYQIDELGKPIFNEHKKAVNFAKALESCIYILRQQEYNDRAKALTILSIQNLLLLLDNDNHMFETGNQISIEDTMYIYSVLNFLGYCAQKYAGDYKNLSAAWETTWLKFGNDGVKKVVKVILEYDASITQEFEVGYKKDLNEGIIYKFQEKKMNIVGKAKYRTLKFRPNAKCTYFKLCINTDVNTTFRFRSIKIEVDNV